MATHPLPPIARTAARADLQSQRQSLTNLLNANLLKRQSELALEAESLAFKQQPSILLQLKQELERTQHTIQEATQRLKGNISHICSLLLVAVVRRSILNIKTLL